MNRFALPILLVSSLAWAGSETATSDQKFAPGAKHSVDEEATNISCVSEKSITGYSRSDDVVHMTQKPVKVTQPSRHRHGSKSKSKGYSMMAVRKNLNANHLLLKATDDDRDLYYDDDSDIPHAEHAALPGIVPPPTMAKDAGPWLYNNGFVNLMDCPKYTAQMLEAKNVPKGAIVVYAGGHAGHIEIKTPSGWWSDSSRTDPGFAKGLKVIGVYIKPVY